jgi:hypothetical protein
LRVAPRGLKATHPGELLREDVFPAMGVSKAQIARRMRDAYDLAMQAAAMAEELDRIPRLEAACPGTPPPPSPLT